MYTCVCGVCVSMYVYMCVCVVCVLTCMFTGISLCVVGVLHCDCINNGALCSLGTLVLEWQSDKTAKHQSTGTREHFAQ